MEAERKRGLTSIALSWGGIGLLAGLAVTSLRPSLSDPADGKLLILDQAPMPLEKALRVPDALQRAALVASLLEGLESPGLGSPKGPPADDLVAVLRDVFEAAPVSEGDVEFALFAAWWARSDPQAALRWARLQPQGGSTSVLVALLEEWGRQDPLAAVRAAGQEALAVRRRPGFAAVMRSAAMQPLWNDRLGEVAGEIPDRAERRAAIRAAAIHRLRRDDADALLRWAKDVPAAQMPVREDFLLGAVMAVARLDPEEATEALAAGWRGKSSEAAPRAGSSSPMASPIASQPAPLASERADIPADVIGEIAAAWSERTPSATIAWLARIAPGETVTDELSMAIREAYQKWIVQDRSAALAWVADRDEITGAWFDPVRATAGLIVGQEDPEEGLRMLSKLPIARERAFKVQRVFAKWKQEAPADAEDWLLKADLPEERKQELRDLKTSTFPRARQPGS